MLGTVLAVSCHNSFAQAPETGEAGDQTALAVPRVGLRGTAGVGIPQPLPPSEASLAKRVFYLQDSGYLDDAARETARLGDNILLGPILADRYLHTQYRATTAELSAWLARFGDQPQAPAVRDLLERMAPGTAISTIAAGFAGRVMARKGANPASVRTLFVENRDTQAIEGPPPCSRPAMPRRCSPAASQTGG